MLSFKYELEPEEIDKLMRWLDKKDLTVYSGPIGGRFTYSFTPTSLGVVVKCYDSVDKDEIDLTDYARW